MQYNLLVKSAILFGIHLNKWCYIYVRSFLSMPVFSLHFINDLELLSNKIFDMVISWVPPNFLIYTSILLIYTYIYMHICMLKYVSGEVVTSLHDRYCAWFLPHPSVNWESLHCIEVSVKCNHNQAFPQHARCTKGLLESSLKSVEVFLLTSRSFGSDPKEFSPNSH